MSRHPRTETLATVFRRARDRGTSIDDALSELRTEGATPIDGVKVLVTEEGLSLAEAKRVVDLSKVWVDLMERTNQVRRELLDLATSGFDEGSDG